MEAVSQVSALVLLGLATIQREGNTCCVCGGDSRQTHSPTVLPQTGHHPPGDDGLPAISRAAAATRASSPLRAPPIASTMSPIMEAGPPTTPADSPSGDAPVSTSMSKGKGEG
jgi:hypothetical protein